MARGFFISFEGGEGAGKSTQIERLVGTLEAHNCDVVVTREPGGTAEAEKIRDLLVQRGAGDWNAMSEVLLLFAARSMHIEKLIKPAMEEGKVVICDRFTDSTVAYQGYGRGMDINVIKDIEKLSIDGFSPDLTFILDIDVEIGLNRANSRLAQQGGGEETEDRFERMNIGFHQKLRDGFLQIAKQDKDRCCVIEADREIDEIEQDIKAVVLDRMKEQLS